MLNVWPSLTFISLINNSWVEKSERSELLNYLGLIKRSQWFVVAEGTDVVVVTTYYLPTPVLDITAPGSDLPKCEWCESRGDGSPNHQHSYYLQVIRQHY